MFEISTQPMLMGELEQPSISLDYVTITRRTEEKIQSLMTGSQAYPAGHFTHTLHQIWAFGVYMGWDALTAGCQTKEDRERLNALTRFPVSPELTQAVLR